MNEGSGNDEANAYISWPAILGWSSTDVLNKLLLADLSIDIFVGGDSMHIGTNHRDQEIRFGKDVQ